MIELRVLALVGLIVTVIVSSLAATGVAVLVRLTQRAWHHVSARRARVAGDHPAVWRLR
jgi:high-affinity K+ transport system ATPase subunit B